MKMPEISLLKWQKRYGTEQACVKTLAKIRWPLSGYSINHVLLMVVAKSTTVFAALVFSGLAHLPRFVGNFCCVDNGEQK